MSRYRNIHSDITIDKLVSRLCEEGPLAPLLYTWGMLHADDWGRITGDAYEFKNLVCPALMVKASEVEAILVMIEAAGLWRRYQVDNSWYIAYPRGAWFKHQSYIDKDKRGFDNSKIPAPPGEEWQEWNTRPSVSGRKRQQAAEDLPQTQYLPIESEKLPQTTSERQKCVPSPSPTPTPSINPYSPLEGEEFEVVPIGTAEAIDSIPEKSEGKKPSRRQSEDEKLRGLFAGFRRGKYPHWTADRYDKIPESEYKQNRSALKSLYDSNATAEEVQAATAQVRNLSWFKNDDQITVPTVARYWTQLCDLAGKTAGGAGAIRKLSEDWAVGDLVEVADGVTAVATHPKDAARPLSTLRFPGMKQSRHESIATKNTPEFNGRRVNLTGNKSDRPLPGWICTDGNWYTLGADGVVIACLADGSDPNASTPSPVPEPRSAPIPVPIRTRPASMTSESAGAYSLPGVVQC